MMSFKPNNTVSDDTLGRVGASPVNKVFYVSPKLTRYGDIKDLTNGSQTAGSDGGASTMMQR